MIDELLEFLRARLNDDERRTERDREVAALLREQAETVSRIYGDADPPKDDMRPADRLWWTARDSADALDRNAARVLAEVDAKRRILDNVARRLGGGEPDGGWESADAETDGLASTVLMNFVQPYASHPEFRDEWRIA